MLSDKCLNLREYFSLDEKLKNIALKDSDEIPEFNSFIVDRSCSYLFTVNKGEAFFATSWRENPSSMEALAVIDAKQGEFVLYLPGEPIIAKAGEGSEVSLYKLSE